MEAHAWLELDGAVLNDDPDVHTDYSSFTAGHRRFARRNSMSGIAGIWNLNGAPVDRGLLEFMTRYLAFRGPDAQESWTAGPVGFGHTLLRTTFESEQEKQPASLNGQIWITADARIDARADLAAKLRDQGEPCRPADPDCELILRAYRAWGEACVEHLLGDFAFAIWDARTQRLFCARDHFGVKPFFYVRVGDHFIFSNTLNCVRIHPAVSEELNERAIADYLLFDGNAESDTTSFREIFRLPAAHSLSVQNGSLNVRRYWTLPVDSPVTYRHANEYVEKFLELLETAVSDRLRIRTGWNLSQRRPGFRHSRGGCAESFRAKWTWRGTLRTDHSLRPADSRSRAPLLGTGGEETWNSDRLFRSG